MLATDADDVCVGTAFLRIYTAPDRNHLVLLEGSVHPTSRRVGVGTQLLETALEQASKAGAGIVLCEVEPPTPGVAFLTGKGFRRVLTLIHARLALAAANTAALAEKPHPGYRLVSWDGVVADELAESFAGAHNAMNDMPVGDSGRAALNWDADRVRTVAEAVANRGSVLHTVAAIADDGTVAAFTEVVVSGDGTGDGHGVGTAVLAAHRGRGLGLWIKAESIRLVRARHPELSGLITDTVDNNLAMRRINEILGYLPTKTTVEYRLDL
jgi:GNAT superfamily N-acetyltransferase